MSLQYIIDGYNIINHPLFKQNRKKSKDSRAALLEMIRTKRLCGSLKNKTVIVFDGFANSLELRQDYGNLEVIFSKKDTADEKIKQLVEKARNPKDMVVVSDDKEIKFFIRAIGAKAVSAEDFLAPKKTEAQNELIKTELTYTQMHKINQELRKIWLE